jgi:transposase
MSTEEVRRAGVLARVQQGELSQVEAAKLLGLSYRQTKRLNGRYRKQGAEGLVHGNAGKRSHHAKPEAERKKILKLVRRHYSGSVEERFGPTLAAEHLEEDHGLKVDAETLRRWMLEAGLWSRERKRPRYRKRRQRRAHFGELVQMDGSFHDWLEGRAGRGCLINMVDDATGIVLCRFEAEETSWAVLETLRAWVERYGIPRAIYADWKNVYQYEPSERQKQAGECPLTQFGRVCAELAIELIAANSAQAKGRVERNHGTHQDRLIKKMRLQRIGDYAAANRYLEQQYLPQHNAKFQVQAAAQADFHDPYPAQRRLEEVFCLVQQRRVSNDWVVQYQGRWLQLERNSAVRAGMTVLVRQWRNGEIRVYAGTERLRWREIERKGKSRTVRERVAHPTTVIPAADHPWRRPLYEERAARLPFPPDKPSGAPPPRQGFPAACFARP